jgi:hypothetical protein
MIIIDDILISDDILQKKFVCDLNACKGACCIEGDSGAPLEDEETGILDDIYEEVKPYLRKEGIAAIEKLGRYMIDSDGDMVTPLIKGKECAYVIFENGIALCGIEKAFLDGKISWKKPISCHLFPIRIAKLSTGEAVNYQEIDICKPACKCGNKSDVPVYKFLKEPIIRKYGEEFFDALEEADKHQKKGKK